MSNGLLKTSKGSRMFFFFPTRYWRHCVPDTLTYLAELNRLKLTGHPASLKIFCIVNSSYSLFTKTEMSIVRCHSKLYSEALLKELISTL